MRRDAILAALREIHGHLAAILIQTIPADDQIIISHVHSAADGIDALRAAINAEKGSDGNAGL